MGKSWKVEENRGAIGQREKDLGKANESWTASPHWNFKCSSRRIKDGWRKKNLAWVTCRRKKNWKREVERARRKSCWREEGGGWETCGRKKNRGWETSRRKTDLRFETSWIKYCHRRRTKNWRYHYWRKSDLRYATHVKSAKISFEEKEEEDYQYYHRLNFRRKRNDVWAVNWHCNEMDENRRHWRKWNNRPWRVLRVYC